MKKFIQHNKPFVIACVVSILLGLYMFGCSPKTDNPFSPGEKVTRDQLDVEVETYISKVKLAYADIEKQEIIRQKISEIGLAYAQGGVINPVGAITTLLGVAGIGAVATYGKKDTLIASLKNTNKELAAKNDSV